MRCYPSGVKRTVVERAQNILTRDEALQHEEQCNQAMLDELKRWLNLGAFERSPKKSLAHSFALGSLLSFPLPLRPSPSPWAPPPGP